jgi:hypothetical protein
MCLSVIPDGLIYGITFDLEAKADTTFYISCYLIRCSSQSSVSQENLMS